jgi:hypothetical protein
MLLATEQGLEGNVQMISFTHGAAKRTDAIVYSNSADFSGSHVGLETIAIGADVRLEAASFHDEELKIVHLDEWDRPIGT